VRLPVGLPKQLAVTMPHLSDPHWEMDPLHMYHTCHSKNSFDFSGYPQMTGANLNCFLESTPRVN